MIADYPFLAGIAAGVDRVIPTDGDNQVFIPPILSPVVESIYPHSVSTLTSDITTTSKFVTNASTYLNVAQQTDPIITLIKGLYRLEFNLGVRANFVTAVLNERMSVFLNYQNNNFTLFSLPINTGTASLEVYREILLTSSGALTIVTPPTNAVGTNSIAFNLSCNIIRRI